MPIEFAGKAETLQRVAPHLTSARVLDLVRVRATDWLQDRDSVLARILGASWITRAPLIVRSSAAAEDRQGQSLAGHFVSVRNVVASGLPAAIDQVAQSFGLNLSSGDEIFVQPMLHSNMSGVALTRDPNTNAPYVVINYKETTDTAAVTGGGSLDDPKTFVYWKGGVLPCPEPLDQVVLLARELERLFGEESLDIEFAFAEDGQLYLFQVRPLFAGSGHLIEEERHKRLLESIAGKIARANQPYPYLRGRRTLYGVMPDWNPAEMIGIRPRPLARSLYEELITDSIWAYQRHNYGYRNLRSFPLMLSFHGLPYIDVRVSFNSFIPSDVSDLLAERLVDYYIDQLAATPVLHDKVEFEIVFSCYTFDIESRLRHLEGRGFSDQDIAELKASLRGLTNRIIDRDTGLWRSDLKKIDFLADRQRVMRGTEIDPVGRIYWLLEDCKRYGTLPFAGLARAAFIAIQMLKSLVAEGALEPRQYHALIANLETTSGHMRRDLQMLPRTEFLAEYGHLRPGTYDILSPRYDEDPDRYFGAVNTSKDEPPPVAFGLSRVQMRTIDRLLTKNGLDTDVEGLFEFLEASIKGREHAKFVFTRSLSDALSLLAELGARHGLNRDDMSFIDAAVIQDLYTSTSDVGATLRHSIAQGRMRYAETKHIALPAVISDPSQVWAFHVSPADPNFITQRAAQGLVCQHDVNPEMLRNAIVVMPSADPGFDWIFSHGIAGFITAYGGVNSHMAIRAGELSLPAVIGAGETLYNVWKNARRLSIDCAAKRVDILE
jgi:glutamine kinase